MLIDNLAIGQDAVIGIFGIHSSIGGINVTGPAAAAWPSANLALFFPFILTQPMTVKKMAWFNGATVSGNVDIGIYDEVGTRLISSGSTAQAGTSTTQEVDITDTYLTPGLYYLAIAMDNTTGILLRSTVSQENGRILGYLQQVSAFALPATATFAALGQAAYIPVIQAVGRTIV